MAEATVERVARALDASPECHRALQEIRNGNWSEIVAFRVFARAVLASIEDAALPKKGGVSETAAQLQQA